MLQDTPILSFTFFNSKSQKALKGNIVRYKKNGLVFKTDSLLNQDSNLYLRIENPPADSPDIRTVGLARVIDCRPLPENRGFKVKVRYY